MIGVEEGENRKEIWENDWRMAYSDTDDGTVLENFAKSLRNSLTETELEQLNEIMSVPASELTLDTVEEVMTFIDEVE